jgi:trans-2-enoyl-CoA reductase
MMLAVRHSRFGKAHEVAEVVELPEPGPPGPGEVTVAMIAASVDPGLLLAFEGRYGAAPPPLPAWCGSQGSGRVTAVGDGVTHLKVGDLVLMGVTTERNTWRERMNHRADVLYPMPPEADPLQLAMLQSTAATARRLLQNVVTLAPGDWVVQNAANSGVGKLTISMARAAGLHTVNLVRRPGLEEMLTARGADHVLVDGPDVVARILEATGGVRPKLGIDAVAGTATGRIAAALAEGGTVVTYGALSGDECVISTREVIFRSIVHCGLWRSLWAARAPLEEKRKFYQELAQDVAKGIIHVDVEATFPLSRVREALELAATPGRQGKILLVAEGV